MTKSLFVRIVIFFENQPELALIGGCFSICAGELGHLDGRENGIRYKDDTFSIWPRAGDLPAGVVRFKYN